MLKNFLKIALRNFNRHRGYTAINLIGLSLGLTIGVLILTYTIDELGYDEMHSKGDRIYKVVSVNKDGSIMETNGWPVAALLEEEFPEVEHALYTRRANQLMLNYETKRYEHEIFYAGADFFNVFDFKLIEGNPQSALVNPNHIVITESMKKRYFGDGIALGKTLVFNDSLDFMVSGVLQDIPRQSHIQFEMLVSFSTLERLSDFSYNDGWGNFNVRNYILLKEGASIANLREKAASLYEDNIGEFLAKMGVEIKVGFIPFNEVYFRPDVGNGFGPKGSLTQIYLVSGIAIFVILLACINFINLSTARSVHRAKEVGLRKVVGSSRSSLIMQFMSESLVVTLMALVIVAILIDFTLPIFNEMIGKDYAISEFFQWDVVLGISVLVIVITLLSGYYPAVVLSKYRPSEVLKGNLIAGTKGVQLRRILVGFQFFISGALILSTIIVIQQLNFMRNQDLGFDKDQILVIDATRMPNKSAVKGMIDEIESLSSVEKVSFTNALPGRPGWLGQWAYPEKEDQDHQVDTEYMAIDENYLPTLGIQLIAGSNFNPDKPSELKEGLIINETTVHEMGWKSPEDAIGKFIVSPSTYPQGKVIGVVKDFHGLGLQQHIWPQAMDYTSRSFGRYIAIRFLTGRTTDLVQETNAIWAKVAPDFTFEYFFLNDDFDRQYKSEDRLMNVLFLFTGIAVIIAMIGLLGLVSFMINVRKKEISIRKILGANPFRLIRLLVKEYAILIIIANVLTIPVIWYFAKDWLQNFAFRMDLNPMVFAVSFVIMIALAIMTVSIQTFKATKANPAETLRNE